MPERIMGPATFTFDETQPNGFAIFEPSRDLTRIGGSNSVTSIGEVPRFIIKSPHPSYFDPASAAFYEALILCRLQEKAPSPPPVTIPDLYNCDADTQRPSNLLTFVPGEVLSPEAVEVFSPAERQRLGRDLGSFVVWITTTISPEVQADISRRTNFVSESRAEIIEYWLNHVDILRSKGCDNLVAALYELSDCYKQLEKVDEDLKIVGHDDLRPDNLTFTKDDDGLYKLAGVIDFGTVKTTDVNHEMRHFLRMHKDIFAAAAAEYETCSGIALSLEQTMVHCRAQVLIQAVFCAINDALAEYPETIAEMNRFYPDKDWSELTTE